MLQSMIKCFNTYYLWIRQELHVPCELSHTAVHFVRRPPAGIGSGDVISTIYVKIHVNCISESGLGQYEGERANMSADMKLTMYYYIT